jgi:hypothetical protein
MVPGPCSLGPGLRGEIRRSTYYSGPVVRHRSSLTGTRIQGSMTNCQEFGRLQEITELSREQMLDSLPGAFETVEIDCAALAAGVRAVVQPTRVIVDHAADIEGFRAITAGTSRCPRDTNRREFSQVGGRPSHPEELQPGGTPSSVSVFRNRSRLLSMAGTI